MAVDTKWALTQSTAPTSEPVTLEEVKAQSRISHSDEDVLIARYIRLAREEAETYARRQFMPASWQLVIDEFPSSDGTITLPMPPLRSITSIVYLDNDGTSQTMSAADYRVDTTSEPGRVTPAYGTIWPSTYGVTGAITITYAAGYDDADSVPERYKQAVLLLAAESFENREPIEIEPNGTVARLLRPDRDYEFS